MSRQLSLADVLVDARLGSNAKLSRIDALIDWSQVEGLAAGLRSGETGRPPYAALSMLKALYLQALYDLSDPGLEEALTDRLSFRRFCGFALDSATPDETTICRFRLAAAKAGVLQRCLAEVNRQLDQRGLMLKKGTLMDASIVAATHNPPRREAGMGAGHPREPGADWTAKNGKSFFGYKLHVGVDEVSGLIRKAVFTSARTPDNDMAEALISGDEAAGPDDGDVIPIVGGVVSAGPPVVYVTSRVGWYCGAQSVLSLLTKITFKLSVEESIIPLLPVGVDTQLCTSAGMPVVTTQGSGGDAVSCRVSIPGQVTPEGVVVGSPRLQ